MSGKQLVYTEKPFNFYSYQRTGIDVPMPILTNIIALSEGTKPIKYSLSAQEIQKLRTAENEGVRLVIYNEGIACLPPLHTNYGKDHYPTMEEYIQLLENEKTNALNWTQQVLSRK